MSVLRDLAKLALGGLVDSTVGAAGQKVGEAIGEVIGRRINRAPPASSPPRPKPPIRGDR